MDNKNKQQKKTPPQQAKKAVKKAPAKNNNAGKMLQQLDDYFKKNRNMYFIISCLLCVVFSIFLFDVKMSNANDDSEYVEAGWKMMNTLHNIYAAKAPLYPLFLSVFIRWFGLKIMLLKSINIVFILLHIIVLYFAFKDRISYFVLMLALLTVSVNSFFQYFASQTFTEALFLFEQALLLFAVVKLYDKLNAKALLKDQWMILCFIGLIAFLMSITRNIAILGIASVILFLVVDRKFMQALISAVAFLLFWVPFNLFAKSMAGSASQYGGQSSIITQKDPYDPSKGLEDFSGYVSRFFDNGQLYISKRIFQILGFKSIDSNETSGFLVFLCAVIFITAAIIIFKNKDKILLFIAVFISVFMAGTFIAIQKQWDQTRLVLVYVQFILLVVFAGYHYWFKNKSGSAQLILVLGLIAVFVTSLGVSLKMSLDNYPILKKNLAGNIYAGWSEDWENYLRMSAYCADSLPAGSFVAARKAPMSFIYGKGKEFFPVYQAFSADADTILTTFKRNKVTHVIRASLRRNPKTNDGQIINTIDRLLYPLSQKYPNSVVPVKQIGESEPAVLYKINY